MENEDIQYGDFENACRLCLRNPLLTRVPLFVQKECKENEESGDNGVHETDRYIKPIVQMINICTGMTLSPDDELPKSICMICSNKLTRFTKFREQCLESERKLEEALQQYQNIEYLKDPFDLDSIENDCSDQERRSISNIEQNEEKSENDEYIVEEVQNLDGDEFFVKEMEIEQYDVDTEEGEITCADELENNIEEEEQQNHKSDKSNSKKKQQCQMCGKMFRSLKRHMNIHYGIKNFKCTICSKAFSSSSNLKEHMHIHSNIRPFKCKYCDCAFNSHKSLKSHEISHTKEEKYKCDICGRKFLYYATYNYHRKAHAQIRVHKCDVCSRDFITKYALKKHYLIHTGEKPYQCPYCDKCFNNSGGFFLHKKTHTKEISIRCENCNVGFVYRATYNNHIKKCRSNDNENR